MGKIALVGGTSKFRDFLRCAGGDFVETTVSDAVTNTEYEGMIFLPDYDNGKVTIDGLDLDTLEALAARKQEGFRVYSENYYSNSNYNDSVFGYEVLGDTCHTSNEALCAMNGLQYKLGDGRIMQAANTIYLPSREALYDPYALVNSVLLSLGFYQGTSQVKKLDTENTYPALLRTGSFITSTMAFTKFDNVNMRPNRRFKKLFGYIFSYVLGVEKENVENAFSEHYPPLKTRFNVNDSLQGENLEELCTRALKDAVKWHFDSGIILGEHGEKGSVEMIMSNNGQKIYNVRRVDSGMYTGWLLYAAGKYFNNDDWLLTGKNVFNYFLEHGQLEGGVIDGMFAWYYNKHASPNQIYSIDLGRDAIALCNMYRLTGDEKLLSDIKRLAESIFGWINEDRLCDSHIDYYKDGKEKFKISTHTRTPAISGEIGSFMAMASALTGDKKYVRKMAKVTDMLIDSYPDFTYYGHTTSSRNARFLLALLPVHLSGERDYTQMINELLDYLESISMPCGGIYSEDNITFERNLPRNSECGITTPWDNDRISDQLYCTNNIIAALSIIKELPDDTKIDKQKGMQLFDALLKYLLKIQIVSDDGRFNGGWMRAYSMTQEEYYGLDADVLWSCYCIMAGWTMGIIPLAILSQLTGECSYVITEERR